jgi:uncharacterized protein YecE (DUF72 family)
MNNLENLRIGCAGWSIPKPYASSFPGTESHLARYASQFRAVEINSTFYRSHRPSTYRRWADLVSETFRFSVKMPRQITHVNRLLAAEDLLDNFFDEVKHLDSKLGPVLVQLPPTLGFSTQAERFFTELRSRYAGIVVCEPRHPTWFQVEAGQLMNHFRIARVTADPAPAPGTAIHSGWDGLVYYRLHGSPQMYYSSYSDDYIQATADILVRAAATREAWCIFDNTALGAAAGNALRCRTLATDLATAAKVV